MKQLAAKTLMPTNAMYRAFQRFSRAEAARALDLIRATTEGRTLLIVEHDMEAVFALADRISVLVRGRVIAMGTPAQIRADARVREAYLGDGEVPR